MLSRLPRTRLWIPIAMAMGAMLLLLVTLDLGQTAFAAERAAEPGLLSDQSKSIDRRYEPLVLRGEQLEAILGMPTEELFVYRYFDGLWQQIPWQVDEVDAAGSHVLVEDGRFDANDELVLMIKDVGNRVPLWEEMPSPDPYLEVEVSDPLSPSLRGWIYVTTSALLTRTNTVDMVSYNPTSRLITSPLYRAAFRAARPGMHYMALGGSPVDLLDRTKLRVACAPATYCPLTEDSIPTNPPALIKDGPVRLLFNNGTQAYGTKLERTIKMSLPQQLRGHLWFGWDFTPAAIGATHYSAEAPDGLTVDGVPESLPAIPFSSWWQVSAAQGTIVTLLPPDELDGTPATSYRDDAATDPADSGDQRRYGEVGYTLVNPPAQIQHREISYFLPGTQPNVGAAMATNHANPPVVEVRWRPNEQMVGAPGINMINLEFSPDGQYVSWVEIGQLISGTEVITYSVGWLAFIDPQTGNLVPSDGRGYQFGDILVDSEIGGAPQWGEDAQGPFVVSVDFDFNMQLTRPISATKVLTSIINLPPSDSRVYPYPAWLPERQDGYVAYLQKDPENRYQAWYVDLADPTVEHQVTFGDQGFYAPLNGPPLSVNIHRWFYGEPIFVYGYTNTVTGRLQIKQFDVSQPGLGPTVITDDDFDHIDEFPTTLFDEPYLISGINNWPVGRLYEKEASGDLYHPVQTIVATPTRLLTPTSALGFEAFEWEGRAYASYQIRNDSSGYLASQEAGEIFVTGLLTTADYQRRISADLPLVRVDPEFYLGDRQVWVYYSARPIGANYWRLYRAPTGLLRPPD